MEEFSFDFNSLQPDTSSEDFERGYKIASVAVLKIEQQIKEEWPNENPAFYRGVIDGLRQEI